MTVPPEIDDEAGTVASHTFAYFRTLDKKLDLLVEVSQRHAERLGRVERDISEVRRDIAEMRSGVERNITDVRRDVAEVKSDIVLLENKVLTAQTESLSVLQRIEHKPAGAKSDD